jgi:hypothetical protein
MAAIDTIRTENKYLLSVEEAHSLQQRLETVLQRDPFCAEGPYPVRSLYYDTPEAADFVTKMDGAPARRKIRLRTYAPDQSPCRLEMKEKRGDAQRKLSLPVSRQAAVRLLDCDYSVLTRYMSHEAGSWESEARGTNRKAVRFYTTMTLQCYRPVTMVEYRRMAYVYPHSDVRITFDSGVRCSESDTDLFRTGPTAAYSAYPDLLLDGKIILEIKFSGALPRFISRILQPYHLTRTAVSKYVLSRPAAYEFIL